jgi:iron(III) transport system permease protein
MSSATAQATLKKSRLLGDTLLVTSSVVFPLIGLCIFFCYPLFLVAGKSLQLADGTYGIANYINVLTSPGIVKAVGNSMILSVSTTAFCLVLGFAVAFALQRSGIGGKRYLRGALSLPLLAPSLVQALGLLFLLGRNGLVHKWTGWDIEIYGFWGLLIANILYALPQAILIIEAALRQSDARYYEAAEILGASKWRQFLDITLPNAKFGILSAGFVVFTVTITDFGNAAVIGGNFKVLATEIYSQVVGQMNFGMGAVIGILLLLPTLIAVYIERVASQKQFGGSSESAIPVSTGFYAKRDVPLGIFVHTIGSIAVIVVITVIMASFIKLWPYRMTFTLANYNITLSGGYAPLWTSLLVSVEAAVLGVIFLFFLAFSIKRISPKIAKIVYLLAVLPVGVPGLVLGISYVLAFNVSDNMLGVLYGSSFLIALCNFYHYHSQGFLTMVTGVRAVPPSLEETVSCFGGGNFRILRDAVLPFMGPTIISVFFFIFMRSMVTLSAVIFLISSKVSVAAVSVMRLDEAGFTSQAAAFSTCIMITVILAMGLMNLLIHLYSKSGSRKEEIKNNQDGSQKRGFARMIDRNYCWTST